MISFIALTAKRDVKDIPMLFRHGFVSAENEEEMEK
jgi:hypothetical protein